MLRILKYSGYFMYYQV